MRKKRLMILTAFALALLLMLPCGAGAAGFASFVEGGSNEIESAATVRDYMYDLKTKYAMDSEPLQSGAVRTIGGKNGIVVYTLAPEELGILIVYMLPEGYYFEDTNARNVIFKTAGETLSYKVISPDGKRFTVKFGTEDIASEVSTPDPIIVTPLMPIDGMTLDFPYYLGWPYHLYGYWPYTYDYWVRYGNPLEPYVGNPFYPYLWIY